MKSERLRTGRVCSHWSDMTPEDKDATRLTLFQKQQGRCAICDREEVDLKSPLVVDHDHQTDVIRGLLCVRCNLLVGFVEHDKGEIARANAYLRVIRPKDKIQRQTGVKEGGWV